MIERGIVAGLRAQFLDTAVMPAVLGSGATAVLAQNISCSVRMRRLAISLISGMAYIFATKFWPLPVSRPIPPD